MNTYAYNALAWGKELVIANESRRSVKGTLFISNALSLVDNNQYISAQESNTMTYPIYNVVNRQIRSHTEAEHHSRDKACKGETDGNYGENRTRRSNMLQAHSRKQSYVGRHDNSHLAVCS